MPNITGRKMMPTKLIPNDAPVEYLPDIDIHEMDTEQVQVPGNDEALSVISDSLNLYICIRGEYIKVGEIEAGLIASILRVNNNGE